MSESLDLPPITQGHLLEVGDRLARLAAARPQIMAALEGEHDEIVIQATLACLLFQTLPQCNWLGFYRRLDERTLGVGPYQGTMGCLRIDFDRGVCGAAAREEKIQVVADVSAFQDHIACDSRTQSECVIPYFDNRGYLKGVLDMDSPHLNGFSREEASIIDQLLRDVLGPSVSWR